jgi:hypothetical protein
MRSQLFPHYSHTVAVLNSSSWSAGDPSKHQESFEDIVRSASYFPAHPVFRRLPLTKHDAANEYAYDRRQKEKSAKTNEALDLLKQQKLETGVCCRKYKEKNSALTPGLFTVFCVRCCVCVGFEMMSDPESPATPFKIFALRAWTQADFDIREEWLRNAVWRDTVTELPSYMRPE